MNKNLATILKGIALYVFVILAALLLKYLIGINFIPAIIKPLFTEAYPEWFSWVLQMSTCVFILSLIYKLIQNKKGQRSDTQ